MPGKGASFRVPARLPTRRKFHGRFLPPTRARDTRGIVCLSRLYPVVNENVKFPSQSRDDVRRFSDRMRARILLRILQRETRKSSRIICKGFCSFRAFCSTNRQISTRRSRDARALTPQFGRKATRRDAFPCARNARQRKRREIQAAHVIPADPRGNAQVKNSGVAGILAAVSPFHFQVTCVTNEIFSFLRISYKGTLSLPTLGGALRILFDPRLLRNLSGTTQKNSLKGKKFTRKRISDYVTMHESIFCMFYHRSRQRNFNAMRFKGSYYSRRG